MRYNDPRDRTSPFIPLSEAELLTGPPPEGWDAALEYHRLKRILPDGPLRRQIRASAVKTILERARDCLRHTSRPTSLEESTWLQTPHGDLDLESSLEAGFLASAPEVSKLQVSQRVQRRASISLVLDMSLSMTGEKVALVAVAAAILALKLQPQDLAITTFDSEAHCLKNLQSVIRPEDLIHQILEVAARGYTNLEAGLRKGLDALRSATGPRRAGIVMTDGQYNSGWDPLPVAPRFPRLHVIEIQQPGRSDSGICQRLAQGGRGRHYRAEGYDDLPRVTMMLVRDLFR